MLPNVPAQREHPKEICAKGHKIAELRIQSSSYGTVECKLLGRGGAWARDQAHMGKAKRDHDGS